MKNYKLIAIAAVGIDGTIGIDGEIPWHIPEDFKHFRNTTMGYPLIVGYNTYLTLPQKAFEGRKYVVLNIEMTADMEKYDDTYFFKNFDSAIEFLERNYDIFGDKIFVAGGAMVYDSLMEYCDEAIITWVNKSYPNANKHFPIEKLFSNFDAVNEQDWQKSKSGFLYKITYYKKSEL